MAFWSDLGNKITDTGGITNSFSVLAGSKDIKGVISGIAGVAGSINDYFNKDKNVEYTSFDINQFRSSFVTETDGGLARTNLFDVLISPPTALDSSGKDNVQRLFSKRVEEVRLPGKKLKTEEISVYGPPRKIVTGGSVYDSSCEMSILLSESMIERKIIIDWMESVQPALADCHDGDVSYYKEYTGSVEIKVYDTEGSPRLTIKLHEAYPVSVNEENMSWEQSKKVMSLKVGFSFRNFTEIYEAKGEYKQDKSLIGMLRGLKDDVRGMITDIRNFRYNFKNVRSNLSSLKYTLSKDFKSSDPLGKISVLAGAPAEIADTLSSSAFRLLNSGGKALDSSTNNYSKYFSF